MEDSNHEDAADLGCDPPAAETMQAGEASEESTSQAEVQPTASFPDSGVELHNESIPATSDLTASRVDTPDVESAQVSRDDDLVSTDLAEPEAGNRDISLRSSPGVQQEQAIHAEALRGVLQANSNPNAAALLLQKQFTELFRARNLDRPVESEEPYEEETDVQSHTYEPRDEIPAPDDESQNEFQGHGDEVPLSKKERRSIAAIGNAEAEEKFRTAKAEFERKRRAKTLSTEEEVEYMKLRAIENARVEQYQAARALSTTPALTGGESLFIPNASSGPLLQHHLAIDAQDTKPRNKRAHKQPTASSASRDGEAGLPKKKKAKSTLASNGLNPMLGTIGRGLEDALVQGGRRKPVKRRGKSTAGGKKPTTTQMTNLDFLMGANVFEQAATTAALPDQPGFEDTTRRESALQQLVDSVPKQDRKLVSQDRNFLQAALRAFSGQGFVKPGPKNTWVVNGMRTGLMHYQVLGAAFMRKRESGQEGYPLGGILADEMGLGKTIMMLANIINGLKPKNQRGPPTLIVASPALCIQWDSEIRAHCFSCFENRHGLRQILTYRGALAKKITEAQLESADIVLTSYWQVSESYPKTDPPLDCITAEQRQTWWEGYYEANRGLLHRFQWHRVVLDEAHQIKNHLSRTSLACRALEATHHWAITGTPVQNSLKEFYPYFKFLRVDDVASYRIYEATFITPDDPDGTERLNQFLRKVMVRRTHADTFFNARLLSLPKPHEKTVWLQFNNLERQIYEIVKMRFIKRINCLSKTCGLGKQYRAVYTMILRLRQMTAHILLVQDTIVDLLEREDFEKLDDLVSAEREGDTEENTQLLLHLRTILAKKNVTEVRADPMGSVLREDDIPAAGDEKIFGSGSPAGGPHARNFRFDKYMTWLLNSNQFEKMKARAECCACHQPPADPQVTSCYHIYCRECLEDLQHIAARRGYDSAYCSECNDTYTWSRSCKDMVKVEPDDGSRNAASENSGEAKVDKVEDWIDMPGPICPSAKTRAVKAQVMNWLDEGPDQKIIIFTQFLKVVKILEKICKMEGWGCCRYTGAMSQESRANSIETFKVNPEKKILLASLKAGGLGLNLTMASRCINLDPWWNAAVEQQAFCRMYRIGQEFETHMERFVIQNSVDTRMMKLNERKNREIATVMDESKRNGRLSTDDLMRMFGSLVDDGQGNPIIVNDDDDAQGYT